MKTHPIELTVNGETVRAAVEPRMHLGDFVRRELGLTGTHLSCEHGVCGACTVLVDGVPQRSCITFAAACDGASVTTIEGYDDDAVMAALRRAFHTHHALQCGYCTPGMLCSARDIVLRLPGPDARRVRHELAGNLCRCTGYVGIVEAIDTVLALKAEGSLPMPALTATTAPSAVPASATAASAGPAQNLDADWTPIDIPTDGDWVEVRQSLPLPLAAGAAFERLTDLPLVARCLPGAEIGRHQGEHAEGMMNVRFGPVSAAFAMRAELSTDRAARRGTMRAEGADRRSATRVKTVLDYAVEPAGDAASRVELRLRFRLAGPLAHFSRGGLVDDYVAELTRRFGVNLSAAVSGQAPPAGEQASGPNLFALLMARLRRWLRG